MISERTLRKWRKEALHLKETMERHGMVEGFTRELAMTSTTMILKLTQELLDQHLLRRK